MKHIFQKLSISLLLLAVASVMYAQLTSGGTPISLAADFQAQYGQLPEATRMPALNLKKILKEDQHAPGTRVAAPISVDFGLHNAGEWTELENGDRLWRLRVQSSGARALSFLYDKLYLPPGAKLFMFNENGSQVLGAYTFESNTPNHTFMTGFIYGETAVLEYYEPKAVQGEGQLHLFRVDHAYKDDILAEKTLENNSFGFGASADCNLNVNCPEGNDWQDQQRGICRIMVVVAEGTGFCTGNLLNNTSEDETPYVLSAFHCQDGFTPMYDFWRFDFNYEGTECTSPSEEPDFQSVLGSTLRASRRDNDFLLLELTDAIPESYNVYFNGWERAETPPSTSVIIHHPRGDMKKISRENDAATIFSTAFDWQTADSTILSTTPPNHMFRTRLDTGTIEAGSSGGALFDQNGRIVGQLHGGTNLGNCGSVTAYFDRFSLSWEGGGTPETRLKDWLDPLETDTIHLDGKEQKVTPVATISGFIRTEAGKGVGGVSVRLTGSITDIITTDTTGKFEFANLPTGEMYGLALDKDMSDDRNGIGIVDILLISQHILGVRPLDTPYKLLAADVDNSESVGLLDIITLRKLILGIDFTLEKVKPWRFVDADYVFTDELNPWNDLIPSIFHRSILQKDMTDFNFIAIKMGDVDLSADPGR